MDLLLWCAILFAPCLLFLYRRHQSSSTSRVRLPPGPPGLPIFGNMFSLGSMPYKTVAGLRKEYGPVVWLKIGSLNTVVLLSADAAAEHFKNHDANFCERKIVEVMKAHNFHKEAISLSPYGSYWRVMKRVMTVEMLVQKRLMQSEPIRRRCVNDMIRWIGDAAANAAGGIQVSRYVFLASFNLLGNLMLSKDLITPKSEEGAEFFNNMVRFMESSGHANIVDLFPWLRWLDPQGLRKKVDVGMGKTLEIVGPFVKERIKEIEEFGPRKDNKDFLDVLLESEADDEQGEPQKIPFHKLNVVLMEIFLAGSETTSSTNEWALVELLRHPEAMTRVKEELNRVVGKGNRVGEEHIDKLPYLQGVVKETMRMHPPIPFLVPRRAMEECDYMGYRIPKDTQLFVNVWAIGRDPDRFEDPMSFKPERFMGSSVDYRGQHHELLPFGAGRRICGGVALAHRMLHLLMGSLLHEFDWSLDEEGMKSMMDVRERIGVTVRKLVPLKVIPTKVKAH